MDVKVFQYRKSKTGEVKTYRVLVSLENDGFLEGFVLDYLPEGSLEVLKKLLESKEKESDPDLKEKIRPYFSGFRRFIKTNILDNSNSQT